MFRDVFPPRERVYSNASESALDQLTTLQTSVNRLERKVKEIEWQMTVHKATQSLPRNELIVSKEAIAQMVGTLDKLQFNGIDGVITAQLVSGKEYVRDLRKKMNKQCETLRSLMMSLHQQLLNSARMQEPINSPMSEAVSLEVIEIKENRQRACCVQYGRTKYLCQRSVSSIYFPFVMHVGPNAGCMLITYFIILAPIGIYAFQYGIATWVSGLLALSIVLTFLSFSMVACSDPGIIRQHYVSSSGEVAGILCAHCQVRRPPNAIHCYDCDICIDGMDHHCPWTGKCIGKNTLYWFYLFLWTICIHITFSVATVVYYCIGGPR